MSNKTGFANQEALSDRGVIGLACDLVDIKPEYSGITKFLLGRVLVVDNIDNALFIARKYRYTLRIVTLEGENLSAGGAISGGAFKNTSNLLGRRREIDDLEKNIKELTQEKDTLSKKLTENRSEMSVVSEELEKINKALQEQSILKNTVELKLRQENDKKNNIINEFKDYTEENKDIAGQETDINKNSQEYNEELSGYEDRNVELERLINEKASELEAKRLSHEEQTEEFDTIKLEHASKLRSMQISVRIFSVSKAMLFQ